MLFNSQIKEAFNDSNNPRYFIFALRTTSKIIIFLLILNFVILKRESTTLDWVTNWLIKQGNWGSTQSSIQWKFFTFLYYKSKPKHCCSILYFFLRVFVLLEMIWFMRRNENFKILEILVLRSWRIHVCSEN